MYKVLDLESIIARIAFCPTEWVLAVLVPFEDRGLAFAKHLASSRDIPPLSELNVFLYRLKRKDSTLSLHDIIKDENERYLVDLCSTDARKPAVTIVHERNARDLLRRFRFSESAASRLAIDISGLPKNLVSELSDEILAAGEGGTSSSFIEYVLVEAVPSIDTSARGLGGTSVGSPRCKAYPELLLDKAKFGVLDVLVFPGYEGYESKLVLESARSPVTRSTIMFDFQSHGLQNALTVLYSNLGLLDELVARTADYHFYFDAGDALSTGLRLAAEAAKSGLSSDPICFVVAPFAEKWTAVVASILKKEYLDAARNHSPGVQAYADTALVSGRQNSTLHSLGYSHILGVSITPSDPYRKIMSQPIKPSRQPFISRDSIVGVDADDTLWHKSKYYDLFKARVLSIEGRDPSLEGFLDRIRDRQRGRGLGERDFVKYAFEVAAELNLPPDWLDELNDAAQSFLNHPVELMPGVLDGLHSIGLERIIVITKGVPDLQLGRMEMSGLHDILGHVCVIPDKKPSTYQALLDDRSISPGSFVMVGDSIRDDLEPVVELGGKGVWMNIFSRIRHRGTPLPANTLHVTSWTELLEFVEEPG